MTQHDSSIHRQDYNTKSSICGKDCKTKNSTAYADKRTQRKVSMCGQGR